MPNRLEKQLAKLGRELADYQTARFFKIPEAMTQTPCDFAGYTSKGRAILIEAKDVNRTSLPIGKKPGLLPHQVAELIDADRAGALSLVVWARGLECVCLTMREVLELSSQRSSVAWKDIAERRRRSMQGKDYYLTLLEPFLTASTKSDPDQEAPCS